jgi:hypothetical protein
LDDFHKSLDQIKKPIEEWESSEERHLSREYGVVVVPLKFTYSESQLLIDELGTDGLERFLKEESAAKKGGRMDESTLQTVDGACEK